MNAPAACVTRIDERRRGPAQFRATELLRWAGIGEYAGPDTDRIVFPLRRVPALAMLYVEGQPLHNLYCVASGSFKCIQNDVEGYEQVLGFALHGDMLGLDALCDHQHASSAVALEDSSVVVLPFTELLAASRQVPALERLLLHATGAELRQRGDTQYLMAAPSSEVRVARFLLHLARRQAALGQSGRRLRLRMTRRDIASCLGVAHETVSRALTGLAQGGCIAVSHRDIEIVDAEGLHRMQRVTRGATRGASAPEPRMFVA
ncbi:MAG: Crp/Fnr family transcriptional regulator [Rubrivivax sp.]|jgi:CRP/FNR family transcriptional regulator